ncbi:dTMP kinase [Halanaerobaculum tunisiense]
MKGKLIVLESGTDASGKKTQSDKLYKRLLEENREVRKVEYPNYKSKSSALVKMYLNGEFGDKADSINPYASSTFFAIDRYVSFQKEWRDFYEEGGVIIADRYTTSNMVHQAAKYDGIEEKEEYLDWLWDLEFNKYELPIPDCVIFLDVPPEQSMKLMKDRKNKFTDGEEKDIHERDYEYLEKSYSTACWIAEKYDWELVECVEEGQLKSIKQIHNEVYDLVQKKI